MIFRLPNESGVACCLTPPIHSSLMSMCVAHVQTLVGVLGLLSRPAQCSKCSGDRFCPNRSCLSPQQGGRCLHPGSSRGIKGKVNRASRCTPELRGVCRGTPTTVAPRLVVEPSELVSMEQKMGLARAGAGLSLSDPTCLLLTEDRPRLSPPSPT